MEALKLCRKTLPLEIDGVGYTLREPSHADVAKYHKFVKDNAVEKDGQMVDMKNAPQMHLMLVGFCLLDHEGKPVAEETLAQWPGVWIREIFEAAQELAFPDPKKKAEDDPKA